MRILIVHEAIAGGGGVESYLAALVPALRGRGHEVAFLHQNPESETGPTRLDFLDVPRASVADEGIDTAVGRMLAWGPDVCFSHNLRALDVEERLASGAPVVKMMHGYFGTCISGQKAHAFPRVSSCARIFGPGCAGLYMPRRCGQLRPLRFVRQYAWASRQNRLFGRYAALVVASEHMADEYRRHGATQVTTAPLFATERLAQPRPLPPQPVVLFVGRMTPLKGAGVLLDAVARANTRLDRPARVVLAGDGPELERCRARASALGVDATFTGWVTGEARTAAFREASIIAVPSLWPEPFALVGLEAAAHGVPAIAFDVGGVREWLRDGVNGRLVRPGDADAFGRTIAAALNSPGELERLGAGARRKTEELTIERHLDIVQRVLAEAAGVTVAGGASR